VGKLESSFLGDRKTCLFEVVAELDYGDGIEYPRWIEDEVSMLERVDVTLDEQKIGTALHGQESTAGDVDAMSYVLGVSCGYDDRGEFHTFEVFNGCPGSGLQLRAGNQQYLNRRRDKIRTWMTACPSLIALGLMMISKSIPSVSITLFNAIPMSVSGGETHTLDRRVTFEIDPQVVGVEDLEFTNCRSIAQLDSL